MRKQRIRAVSYTHLDVYKRQDEDLRDAAEILVTDCSCYTPFRAFLMDVVQSDFAFMPNKLDLIRDIACLLYTSKRKSSYCCLL